MWQKRRRAGSDTSDAADAPRPARPPVRTAALLLLGRRDYTISELRARLLDREYDADAVTAVIAALVADRSLDDRRVAASHARTSSAIKGRGRHRIQRELDARGVQKDVVRDIVGTLSPADEEAAIVKLIERKRLPSPLDAAARRRVFQQLLRRGFPSDAVTRVLKRRGVPPPDDDDF